MGSYTKTVYFCDICEKELGTEKENKGSPLTKCPSCEAEVCSDCIKTPSISFKKDESDPGDNISSDRCKKCMNNEQKVLKELMKELYIKYGNNLTFSD